jgi:hypothetical protein
MDGHFGKLLIPGGYKFQFNSLRSTDLAMSPWYFPGEICQILPAIFLSLGDILLTRPKKL